MDMKDTTLACTQCGNTVPWMQAWPGDKCQDCFREGSRERIRQQDAAAAQQTAGRMAIDEALYTTNPLDLGRTRQALTEYDTFMATNPYQFEADDPQIEASFQRVQAEENRLAHAVGEAFGHDTADRNNFETCQKCVRPDVWLRNLVTRYT